MPMININVFDGADEQTLYTDTHKKLMREILQKLNDQQKEIDDLKKGQFSYKVKSHNK